MKYICTDYINYAFVVEVVILGVHYGHHIEN